VCERERERERGREKERKREREKKKKRERERERVPGLEGYRIRQTDQESLLASLSIFYYYTYCIFTTIFTTGLTRRTFS